MPNNFYQLICERRHYTEQSHTTAPKVCSVCNAPIMWINKVFNDNDQQEGYIDPNITIESLSERLPMEPMKFNKKYTQIGFLYDMGTFFRYKSLKINKDLQYPKELDFVSLTEFYNIFFGLGYNIYVDLCNPSEVYILT